MFEETLRIDYSNHILGLRLNIWTCIVVFGLGLAWFLRHGGLHAERESTPYPKPRDVLHARDEEPADGGSGN